VYSTWHVMNYTYAIAYSMLWKYTFALLVTGFSGWVYWKRVCLRKYKGKVDYLLSYVYFMVFDLLICAAYLNL
jgi:hypothetical protein